MTELITQRRDRDCYLCCVSMAASVSHAYIRGKLTHEELAEMDLKGTSGPLLEKIMSIAGLTRGTHFQSIHAGYLLTDAHDLVELKTKMLRLLLWGRRAIIQVPSLNLDNEMHVVYWDGSALFDPSTKLRYERWEDVPLNNYITIFNEENKC
jgi:hypothetical protein